MNFYEELDREMKNAGLEGKIISVPEELRPTVKDFIELDERIEKRTEENRNILFLSEIYAANGMPCENIETKKQNKTKKLTNNKWY